MKGEAVYKRTYNRLIVYLGELKIGDALDSENVLKSKLNASRTTIRKVLRDLELKKLITIESTKKFLCRRPKAKDSFSRAETLSNAARIEKKFLEWMLRADPKPGDIINELELARQFGVSTSGIREFLNRFSRFKLIERRPNSGWCFQGFTEDFALELFEVRELFEMRSAMAFATLPDDAIAWKELKVLESDHKNLLRNIKRDFHNFSDIDERFHQLVNNASMNRFIVDFYDLISLIFHYHYQWNKVDERKCNQAAVLEHLAYIDALFSRDPKQIQAACKKHFVSARNTLLSSLKAPVAVY